MAGPGAVSAASVPAVPGVTWRSGSARTFSARRLGECRRLVRRRSLCEVLVVREACRRIRADRGVARRTCAQIAADVSVSPTTEAPRTGLRIGSPERAGSGGRRKGTPAKGYLFLRVDQSSRSAPLASATAPSAERQQLRIVRGTPWMPGPRPAASAPDQPPRPTGTRVAGRRPPPQRQRRASPPPCRRAWPAPGRRRP